VKLLDTACSSVQRVHKCCNTYAPAMAGEVGQLAAGPLHCLRAHMATAVCCCVVQETSTSAFCAPNAHVLGMTRGGIPTPYRAQVISGGVDSPVGRALIILIDRCGWWRVVPR
jgi:hypothetical protein